MISINAFIVEKLNLSNDSTVKSTGAFRKRRRNRIDSSNERKAYVKFIEFFKALSEMPGLRIALGNIKHNDFDDLMFYKVKYTEDISDIPENDKSINNVSLKKYKDFLGWIITHLDSYEDVIDYYIGKKEYIFSLCIYKNSLDYDEIKEIEGLNLFTRMHADADDEKYIISLKDLIENIDEINKVFVD